MGQSAFTIDRSTTTGVTNASGTATFTVDCSTADQVYRIEAYIFYSSATSSHLSSSGAQRAEYVVTNKNGVVAALAAQANSANPDNANTTTFVASHPNAADSAIGNSTASWSVSGTNAVLTVDTISSVGGAVSGINVTVHFVVYRVGST